MKIALFSDVHANLPAFKSFLKSLDKERADAVYCLGDLVGYNVWPNEVIAEIRRRGIPAIAGNHDVKLNNVITDFTGKNHAYSIISQENRNYLKSLPAHIRLEYQPGTTPLTVLLVHGSPKSNDEYILADLDENYVRALLVESKAGVLICAHSHKPYHRVISNYDGSSFYHIINTGSVGKPKDGNPKGVYVLLSLDENSCPSIKESIEVDFIRFEYDVEEAAKAIEASPLPAEFADRLRKAY